MNRREIITLLCGVVSTPVSVLAQSSNQRVIGFLNGGSAEPYAPMVTAFLDGLKRAGLAEGPDIAVVYRWADGDYARLPRLAADLVTRNVDVIAATGGDVSALAAQSATTTIPIVFNIGGDPVQLGLIASLNRPGGNITGVVQFTFELARKRLDILRELVPRAEVVAALLNPTRPNAQGRLREVQEAAQTYGKRLVVLNAADEDEIDAAFTILARERAGALLVGSDPFFLAEGGGSSNSQPAMASRQSTTGATTRSLGAWRATERASLTPISKSACTSGEFSRARSLPICQLSSRSGSSS